MPEYFCSCGFWVYGIEKFGDHLRENRAHYRINKTRWKKLVEDEGKKG